MILGSCVVFAFFFCIWLVGETFLDKDTQRNTFLGFCLSVGAGIGAYIVQWATS